MFILRSLLVLGVLAGCVEVDAGAGIAPDFKGAARVVDGDTLAIDGVNLRIFGIDAPERGQSCGRGWDCGAFSRGVLEVLVASREVTCAVEGEADRYGRPLVLCAVQGVDLGQHMVRAGAAMAYRRYSQHYVEDETVARAAGIGIWGGAMETPESYRHRKVSVAADGCDLKGNIGMSGRIFHAPGQRDYGRTEINPAKGERWFCSVAEAEAAGFRAARR